MPAWIRAVLPVDKMGKREQVILAERGNLGRVWERKPASEQPHNNIRSAPEGSRPSVPQIARIVAFVLHTHLSAL